MNQGGTHYVALLYQVMCNIDLTVLAPTELVYELVLVYEFAAGFAML